ncbi:YdcF family protein [Fundicoccus culcitae]|uniref:YdcF family protein n=1 Tax=Fundicoccus culcitae TaxID=2969821 RepID=A0ABY5P9A6_9LACT|nr:YdcF family protein [Fundicoccus culcitae]UUX35254.1 YdcF family protein [Fundicoccus culcitae]
MKTKIMLVIVTLILLLGLSFLFIYFNLDIGEEPVEADIIIVNEGLNRERSEKVAELLEAGYANQVIISPSLDHILQWYYDLGIEENQIVHEDYATSTWTNALNSLAIMEEHGWDSALVVSSDYHMQRVRLSYERAMDQLEVDYDLTYVSAYPEVNGEQVKYTQNTEHQRFAIVEVFKYIGYGLGLYEFVDL